VVHPSPIDEFKEKVWVLLGQRPFVSFRIVLESGDVLTVDLAENFSMWPGPEANSFHLYGERGRSICGHFAKVTSVEARESDLHSS
jgi:hypothetical protein